ncbi:MAG TPA: hypothetical protein VGM94_03030 [Galbitalea sp.]|jgi:hypothetical protein
MSAPLEQKYRRALRWYPKRWRAENEDVVVGTLLDVAGERGERTPTRTDLRSLHLHGLAARFGFLDRILTRAIRDRVSAIALGTGFALSAWAAFFEVRNARGLDRFSSLSAHGTTTTFGPFVSLAIILYLTWLLAFGASFLGRPWLLRLLLVATIPAAIVARVVSEQLGMSLFPSTTTVLLLEIFALFAVLGTPRPTARWRVWIGLSAAVAIALITWVLRGTFGFLVTGDNFAYFGRYFFFEAGPIGGVISGFCAGGAGVAILCLVLQRWTWAAVVTISMLPWFALYVSRDPGDFVFWTAAAIVVAVLAIAITLRARGLRLRITLTRD